MIPQRQLEAIRAAHVDLAPAHILAGARDNIARGIPTVIYFDSGADESCDLGYGFCPDGTQHLFFHPLLGRVVARLHIDGRLEILPNDKD